jgi:hypothetical protein
MNTIDETALGEWAAFYAITIEQARAIFDAVESDNEAEALMRPENADRLAAILAAWRAER